MYLTKEELEKLPTSRLLAYKRKRFKEPDLKNLDEWDECYTNIKQILASREHIPRRKRGR